MLRSLHTINKLLVVHQKYSTFSAVPGKVSAFLQDRYVVIDVTPLTPKTVGAKTEEHLKYPLLWLRDNCQCSECFHKGSSSRVLDWCKFDVDVKPVKVNVS